jgi:hypothetical protein
MHFIDGWVDLWRLGNLLVGLLCLGWLVGGLIKQHADWNVKTRDFWYSRIMWAVTQCVLSIEGIRQGAGATIGLVLITAAGIVTFKGLNRKGAWGWSPK